MINLVNETEVEGKAGYKMGELAVTSLIHYGFPLVNYILGDTIEVREENGIKYITNIIGRTNDVIKNRDGSSFAWLNIYRIMLGITDITQFRVVQKTYEHLVFMLAAKELRLERKKEIEKMIQKRALQYLGGSNKDTSKTITFEWCEYIKPDAAGKTKVLISEV